MPITDAFTAANGTGIEAYSSNWAYMAGSGTNFQIQSNGVQMAAVTLEGAVKRTESGFPNDHYAQVTPAVLAPGGSYAMGVAVRCQAAGTADYYGFYGTDILTQMFEYDGTTWTQMGSNGAGANVGQAMRLTVSGSTITPSINGVTQNPPGAQSDATYSTGAPGISGFNNGATSSDERIDDFECSDVSGGAGTTSNVRRS